MYSPFEIGEHGPLYLWESDAEFQLAYARAAGHTMVSIVRCYTVFKSAVATKYIKGIALEVGVWKGGTGRLIASALPMKEVYLFDTFAGLPPVNEEIDRTFHHAGMFNDAPYEAVKEYLRDLSNVHVIRGTFPASIPPRLMSERIAFAHVDVDLYTSAIDCLTYLYERMSPGGLILFDDYGFASCPGVQKAVDGFFVNRHEEPIYLPTGQCLVIKLDQRVLSPYLGNAVTDLARKGMFALERKLRRVAKRVYAKR